MIDKLDLQTFVTEILVQLQRSSFYINYGRFQRN